MNNTQIFAFFILPALISCAVVAFALLFNRLNKPKEIDKPKKTVGRTLYNYDLDEWNYLGTTELTAGVGEVKDYGYVFFFTLKSDTGVRDYHVPNRLFRGHAWLDGMAEPWKAGEREYYTVINKAPSSYLKNYMKENYNSEWCSNTNWWVPIVKQDPGTYWGA